MVEKKEESKFSNFVLLQAQNAGLFLGKIPHPATGQANINLKAAKSVLDSLEVLVEKTKGNLTIAEQNLLNKAVQNVSTLYQEVLEKYDKAFPDS